MSFNLCTYIWSHPSICIYLSCFLGIFLHRHFSFYCIVRFSIVLSSLLLSHWTYLSILVMTFYAQSNDIIAQDGLFFQTEDTLSLFHPNFNKMQYVNNSNFTILFYFSMEYNKSTATPFHVCLSYHMLLCRVWSATSRFPCTSSTSSGAIQRSGTNIWSDVT